MIKKVISITLLIIICILTFQFGVNFFKTEHYTEYFLKVGSKSYAINEKYSKKNNEDYYLLEIKDGQTSFIFTVDNYFNKQKQIVKDIISYNSDEISCITLVYVGNNHISSPLCSIDNNLYSFISVKDKYDFTDYLNKIPQYSSKLLQESENYNNYADISVSDNLYADETLLIYNYKNFIKYDKEEQYSLQFSNFDNYKNEFGYLIDKYYLIPDIENSTEFSKYLLYDLKEGYNDEIELPNNISRQSYINGIYDGKLYIFDKSNKVQYSIDPSNKKVEITADENNSAFVYQDGRELRKSVYDLANDKVLFSPNVNDYKNIKYDSIYVYKDFAVYSINGDYYKIYKDYINNPIFLFNDENVKEMRVKKDRLYYIKDNFLYRYDDYGLVKLVKREEFRYNFENIYDVYINQ